MIKKIFVLFIVIASIAKQSQAQNGIITTVAGNGTTGGYPCAACYGGDGGPATAAELQNPTGIAFDAAGNMYIADFFNDRIRMVNTLGIITTVAGIDGSLYYSGDGGQATAANLNGPTSVVFDAMGNMYITDSGNNLIRMVNTLGIITTAAGDTTGANSNANGGCSGDGGQATAAQLDNPQGISIDVLGNLYISDDGCNRIRKINTNGIINTIAGGGGNYSGDGGPATAAGLGSCYRTIVDAAGNLYISSPSSCLVRKVNSLGIISTIAGITTGANTGANCGYNDNGGQATASYLKSPIGLAVDGSGNLYIGDTYSSLIRKINSLGIISIVAGDTTGFYLGHPFNGYSGDGGQATAAKLNAPNGIAFDAVGNLYIVDTDNNVIRKVTICNNPSVNYTLANTAPHYWTAVPAYSSNVTSARWYWGDGTDTLALYPSHTYSVAGRYNICVTAYSACGDSAQSCQNDTVYRIGNNSAYSSMVYINVDSSSTHTTGINKLAINNTVNIYPNPNKGSFVIEPSSTTKKTMQVYDVNGKLVLSQAITGKTTIDAGSLNEGVYNISMISNEGVVNKKLVIVR